MPLDDGSPPPPQGSPRFRVSTDWLPERDRIPFFREELGKLLNVDVEPINAVAPRYTMDFTVAGPIGISLMDGSATHFVRDRRHLKDSDDAFVFVLLERGEQVMRHNGHSLPAVAGDAYLINNAAPSESFFTESVATVRAIRVDHNALGALVRHPEKAAGASMAHARPALALMRGYLKALGDAQGLSQAILQNFGLHVIDLIAAAIGASPDGAEQAASGGVKAARLREILAAIARGACEPGFGVNTVAAQLAVTPRYVNRLLEETGRTFFEHVVEQRLVRAWRLLSDPQCVLKIANIAFETGFNDLSHFNRAFRRRFGETPTAVRGANRAAAPPLARSTSSVSLIAAGVDALMPPGGGPDALHA